MSEKPAFTNEQKKMFEFCYRHPRTHAEVARRLRCDVSHVRELTSFRGSPYYLYVDLKGRTGYDDAPISLEHDGIVLVESLRADRADRRRLTRRFWVQILLGGILGWLLSSLGTPKDLLQSLARLFGL